MSIYLFLIFILVSSLHAQRLQTNLKDNAEMEIQRFVAAGFLFEPPIRQIQQQLLDSMADSAPARDDSSPRTKRIYWENLAFHAMDYKQKRKKG